MNFSMEKSAPGPLEQYEGHYETLRRRVARRRSPSLDLAWLFDGANTRPVVPDYLEFRTAGRNRLERLVNQSLFRLSKNLWFRLFWPQIRDGLLDYSRKTYFPIFFEKSAQTPEIEAAQKVALAAVEAFLARPWDDLGRAAFTEVGFLVNEVLQTCYGRMGAPDDLFADEKRRQNEAALGLAAKHLDELSGHPNRLEILAYGSCQANWIDSLEGEEANILRVMEEDIGRMLADPGQLADLARANFYYQIDRFRQLVSGRPKHILFEGDNCGELVFDLLLVQYLMDSGHRVTLGAKARPTLNDATVKDVAEVLEAEPFAPLRSALAQGRLSLLPIESVMGGKLLYEVSEAYKQAYGAADLVILKGQGNFQTMPIGVRRGGRFIPYRYRKPMAVLLPVKSVMSRLCLDSILTAPPEDRSLFLYCYDPSDPSTYP